MRRELSRLADETFDLLIVGGGVTGAAIARDAALRGLSVALIEKNDFAHATSSANSKLIHGGLRYLRNFELGLVREALRERRFWQRIAPHQVRPLPFLLPLRDKRAKPMLGLGLTLYDLLAYDRGGLADPEQRLPGHRWLDAAAAIAREPAVESPGLTGAFLYYDCQMYAPERLALEMLVDAADHGAALANYVEAEKFLLHDGRIEGASVRERFTDARFDVRAKLTVNASGPWADIFLGRALGRPSEHKLLRSKGIHIVTPAITRDSALAIGANGGHFFVLPWRGRSLIGTTDTAYTGAPDAVGVTQEDVDAFLATVNKGVPNAKLTRDSVRHFYAGLRPLVDDGESGTYNASRRSELVDHARNESIEGLVSAIGGKWTSSRHLAEKAVDAAVAKLGAKSRACVTQREALPGGRMGFLSEFLSALRRERPKLAAPEHLGRLYGARIPRVLSLANEAGLDALGPTGDVPAQILFAAREEMAMTLDDAVMRRTGLGQLGDPGAGALEAAAAIMASELGWNARRTSAEIEKVRARFRLSEGAA